VSRGDHAVAAPEPRAQLRPVGTGGIADDSAHIVLLLTDDAHGTIWMLHHGDLPAEGNAD